MTISLQQAQLNATAAQALVNYITANAAYQAAQSASQLLVAQNQLAADQALVTQLTPA